MSPIRRILSFLKPYWKLSLAAILLLVCSVLADLAMPQLIQKIIDQGITQRNMEIVFNTALIMIGLSILEAFFTIGNTLFSVRAAQSFSADVRSRIFHKIQSFSFGNLDRFQTGQLMVRMTSDVNQMQMAVMMSLRILVRAPLIVVGSVVLMWIMNPELAKVFFLLMPFTLALAFVFIIIAQPLFLKVQAKLDKLNKTLQENLAGMRVVKAFVREKHEAERFEKANIDLMKQSTRVLQLLSVLFPTMFLIINLGVVGIIWFGGQQVTMGGFTVGELMAFINYLLSSMFPLLMMSLMAGLISAANASAQRIYEVLDFEPKVQNRPGALTLGNVSGRVAFEDVCFSYSGECSEPALKNINLVAEPGQTVAILGATGSGKSTIINLIPRFYDVTEGRITIDGIDIRDVTIESLRSNIGIALQETVLFSGTIRDNVRYGRPDATEEEVIETANIAQAHDFITKFSQGYETIVGQRGVNLSGGQKQRIAIARALLVKPSILILDDSTSSVDFETETKIQEALSKFMEGRTTFVIAQRISTVLKADKIVVVDKGQIVAEGNHWELMKSSPIYREIYESQLGVGGAAQ